MKLKKTELNITSIHKVAPGTNNTPMYEGRSDYEIWRAFKAGDEKAFSYIYQTHAQALFNFGYQLTDKLDLIKDAVQNMFINFHKRKSELSDVVSIKSFLYKCLYRELLKRLEKQKRFSLLNEWNNSFEIEVSFETKMIQEEINQEKRERLQKVLNQLTFKQKKALLLFYDEELSYREVAEVMGLNDAKQARKLIYRALSSAKSKYVQSGESWLFSNRDILSLGLLFMSLICY